MLLSNEKELGVNYAYLQAFAVVQCSEYRIWVAAFGNGLEAMSRIDKCDFRVVSGKNVPILTERGIWRNLLVFVIIRLLSKCRGVEVHGGDWLVLLHRWSQTVFTGIYKLKRAFSSHMSRHYWPYANKSIVLPLPLFLVSLNFKIGKQHAFALWCF